MGNSINQTIALSLTNKSGVDVQRGDVVVLGSNTAESFISASGTALSTDTIGVVLDSFGIANNSRGLIAVGGYIPQINLISGSALGDTFGISAITHRAIPHATVLPGDFGQALGIGTTPSALLWNNIQGAEIADYHYSYFTGATISLILTGTGGWLDVDSTNAVINFTPKSPGKYEVVFEFSHNMNFSSTAHMDMAFRISDGTTHSPAIRSYMNEAYAGTHLHIRAMYISMIFDWNVSSKTIVLQYAVAGSSGTIAGHNISTGLLAGFISLGLIKTVKRLGS